MKVGDLVRYGGSKDCLGIVTRVVTSKAVDRSACAVRWANGVTSHHSTKWLIPVKPENK